VVFTFVQGGELRYVDSRTFGELYVSKPPAEGAEVEISKFARLSIGGDGLALRKAVPELAHLGIDPFEDQIGWDRFAAILRSRSTGLKVVLTDQDIIAGIGNIYSDEILFAAGLRFDRESESLSTIEIRRLHRAISEILTEAIKHGGSTLDDEQFVDPDGNPGSYQQLHQVYNREGLPCLQCRTTILRDTVRGRSTFYCPKCQS
jgi:formamidopyrimidine-DNA glycosylase